MKKKLLSIALTATMMFGATACAPTTETNTVEPQQVTVEREMTVDEFVSLPGDFYFIVKDIDTWAVLEEDVYMEREIVEVAVCDDTENTICLFIKLEDNEKPRIKQW